jgi:hypothetical protein
MESADVPMGYGVLPVTRVHNKQFLTLPNRRTFMYPEYQCLTFRDQNMRGFLSRVFWVVLRDKESISLSLSGLEAVYLLGTNRCQRGDQEPKRIPRAKWRGREIERHYIWRGGRGGKKLYFGVLRFPGSAHWSFW